MKKFIIPAAAATAISAAGLNISAQAADQQFISIGTGGVTGVYYPAGGAICRMVNKNRKEHGIRCSAESTDGSIYNINTIKVGELEFGVAQSDWQYHAYNGTSKFEGAGKHEKLRAVFSIHPEPVTVIAKADADVKELADLKGKRVNIGPPGSGIRGTWEALEQALGWDRKDLELAAEIRYAETAKALCDGKIDVNFAVVGHPSALTQEALAICNSVLIDVSDAAIDKLVADTPYYRAASIPADMYNNSADIKTFGVGATFVSSSDVSERVVYTVVKAVFENFDAFKKLHPALGNLKPEEMIKDALTAPLHGGAVKYYKEKGWM